ncbi:protein RICE SALT SENSITIVE 3-like [Zingiber officinale]|uniref:protein RICE SALT SENSITIVE 3-like n=1 Tax=Zingiber officinale TaxID=94328 RepID=UPI001C4C0BE1|nr:protein RICE SALT SENSITIVE 3-like [Zingiber officinale]XP_042383585.1 protein RICE SALT SENSITIVE 3-like [Zingiber officinale]XP_042383593.1 protein RICE SALT SENSITIVE 3-like [Zingiber officinale]XP_042383602.1 protein RICE SALT SENSITIVE 3-like [Zingiber officinale]
MVGSGRGDSRSKEAIGVMALHEALRNVCLSSDWTYSVFWTIRPRPRSRSGNVCKVVGDDNGSLMLMWEDGFCQTSAAGCVDGEDPVRKAFSKMSIQLYNYGEGLMGKVASDKCHKWVFKEPSDQCEASITSYWQSSFDALPPEWTDQFASGIQTIAVIQVGHGLLQLGSCKIIAEDLHFVLRMRHMFESLGHQSSFFLSQLYSSRNSSATSSVAFNQMPAPNPPSLYNWSHSASLNSPAIYQPSPHGGFPNNKDATRLFLPRSAGAQLEEPDPDLRWPNGLSFFSALTGRPDDAKILFNSEVMGEKIQHASVSLYGNGEEGKGVLDTSSVHGNGGEAVLGVDNTEDFLSLESHSSRTRKMENMMENYLN